MTEPTTVEDNLNRALRTMVDDLMAHRPAALKTFEAWCLEHSEDTQILALLAARNCFESPSKHTVDSTTHGPTKGG